MKRTALIFSLAVAICSCGNSGTDTATSSDTLGTNPSAIEEQGTQHATGVTNQNVISTDTAAMNVEKMSDTTGGQ
jgi:hypothetical protein